MGCKVAGLSESLLATWVFTEIGLLSRVSSPVSPKVKIKWKSLSTKFTFEWLLSLSLRRSLQYAQVNGVSILSCLRIFCRNLPLGKCTEVSSRTYLSISVSQDMLSPWRLISKALLTIMHRTDVGAQSLRFEIIALLKLILLNKCPSFWLWKFWGFHNWLFPFSFFEISFFLLYVSKLCLQGEASSVANFTLNSFCSDLGPSSDKDPYVSGPPFWAPGLLSSSLCCSTYF